MKSLKIGIISLLFMGSFAAVNAQDPAPLPLPAIPDAEMTDSMFTVEKINMDLLEKALSGNGRNLLSFCGQSVDLDRRDRNAKLSRELALITRNSSMLMARANYYFPRIEPILRANNIPDDFKYLMVVESFLDPNACSPKGAAGLWQFMPETARDYGLVVDGRMDERFMTVKATNAACKYLKDAYRKFRDWVAVAQSYNIGQGCVGNELARQKVDEAIDLHLADETNRYIYRILATKIVFTNPSNFGVSQNALYYKRMGQLTRRN